MNPTRPAPSTPEAPTGSDILRPLAPAGPEADPAGPLLVTVPHAGGSSHAFRGWAGPARDRGLRLYTARTSLPGTPLPVEERARRLAAALERLAQPYVLVGHSLGALIALETVRHLEREHPRAVPSTLVVCATNPPHLRTPVPPSAYDTDEAATEFLRRVGGTPREVLDDPGMRALAVRMLRGDLVSLAGYTWRGHRLSTPTCVCAGRQDPVTPPELLPRWAEVARSVTVREFDGGHFFPHERPEEVLDALGLGPPARRASPPPTPPPGAARPPRPTTS